MYLGHSISISELQKKMQEWSNNQTQPNLNQAAPTWPDRYYLYDKKKPYVASLPVLIVANYSTEPVRVCVRAAPHTRCAGVRACARAAVALNPYIDCTCPRYLFGNAVYKLYFIFWNFTVLIICYNFLLLSTQHK